MDADLVQLSADAFAVVAFTALAAVLLLGARRHAANGLLALLMLVVVVNTTAAGLLHSPLAQDRVLAYRLEVATNAAALAAPSVYLLFMGRAIPSPILAPLRIRVVRAALWLLAAAPLFVALLVPHSLVPGPGAVDAAGRWDWTANPAFRTPAILAIILASLLGLAGALDALRRSPVGTAARERARAYAIAFGLSDATVVVFYATILMDAPPPVITALYVVTDLAFVATSLLVGRALLRQQLFDFDLKLKWTLGRSTLVAVFVAIFFVSFAIAEQWLQQYGVIAGGVAVGLLLFALRPIERAAQRLADRAMPRVQDTQEYRTVRRREVYRAAVESAMADGVVTDRERDVLATLADQLGVGAKEALDIEREVTAARASGAAA